MPAPREKELPTPSPELILLASLTRCFLRQMPKKDRKEFLAAVTEDLRWQTGESNIVRIRPAGQGKEVAEARAKAAAWWEAIGERLAELAR